ncbi:hypothetical protein RFI_16939, partial [Reticulomyxa filosa]
MEETRAGYEPMVQTDVDSNVNAGVGPSSTTGLGTSPGGMAGSGNGGFTGNHTNKSGVMARLKPDYTVYPASLRLRITNDTFMGRLSRPMWWIDGQFNQIPNKILSKNVIEIEVFSNYSDAPLVGILSFELTLDPRYQDIRHYANAPNIHHMPVFDAFSVPVNEAVTEGKVSASYFDEHMPYYHGPVPPWMIGPAGLMFVPPSVHRMYHLQQQFADKQIEKLVEQYKNKDMNQQIKEQKREARVSKMVEKGVRQHEKSLAKAMKQLKKEKREGLTPEATSPRPAKSNETTEIDKDKEKKKTVSANVQSDDSGPLSVKSDKSADNNNNNNNNGTANANNNTKERDEEDADGDADAEMDGEEDENEDEDDELEEEVLEEEMKLSIASEEEEEQEQDNFKAPKFRILLLWSVQPQAPPIPVQGADTQMLRQKRLSNVSVSTDVNHPNKFDVLLFEDDVNSEFHLDHSYFTQLEESALLADMQQKLIEHDLFEISATLGINRRNNQYQFVVDVDDSTGQWPFPPKDLYSELFTPPFIHHLSSRTFAPIQRNNSTPLPPIYDNIRLAPHDVQSSSGMLPSPRVRRRLTLEQKEAEEKYRSSRLSKRVGSHTLSELVTQVDRDKEYRSSTQEQSGESRVPIFPLYQSTTNTAAH